MRGKKTKEKAKEKPKEKATTKTKKGGMFLGPPPPPHANELPERLDQLAMEKYRAQANGSEIDDDIGSAVDTRDPCSYVTFARGNTFGLLTNENLHGVFQHHHGDDPITRQPLHDGIRILADHLPRRSFPVPQGLTPMKATFSKDGTCIIAGTLEGYVLAWKVLTREPLFETPIANQQPNMASVRKIWLPPNDSNNRFYIARIDGVVEYWTLTNLHMMHRVSPQGLDNHIYVMDVRRDAEFLISSSRDGHLSIIEVATGRTLRTIRAHQGMVMDAQYSPDGSLIATAGHDRKVKLWRAATMDLMREFQGQEGVPHKILFGPDGNLVACGSGDGAARTWNVHTGVLIHTLRPEGRAYTISSIAFSADRGLIIIAGMAPYLSAWNGLGHYIGRIKFPANANTFHYELNPRNRTQGVWICNHGGVHRF